MPIAPLLAFLLPSLVALLISHRLTPALGFLPALDAKILLQLTAGISLHGNHVRRHPLHKLLEPEQIGQCLRRRSLVRHAGVVVHQPAILPNPEGRCGVKVVLAIGRRLINALSSGNANTLAFVRNCWHEEVQRHQIFDAPDGGIDLGVEPLIADVDSPKDSYLARMSTTGRHG